MKRRGSKGTAELARVLDGHARKRARRDFPASDLGTIQADMSLLLDGFRIPFPQGGYIVSERFLVPNPINDTGSTGGGSGDPAFEAHVHTIPRPNWLRPLAAGHRVVCVILDSDTDSPTPVVVERLA